MASVRVEGTTYYGEHVGPQHVMEHTAQVDGRLVNVRQCGYCWAEYYERFSYRPYFCSPECSRRNAAWNGWVRDTNHAAIRGDVNKPIKLGAALPPAGKTLEQVQRFVQPQFELVRAVA